MKQNPAHKQQAETVMRALPSVRGRVQVLAMDKLTWFRTGGYACVFTPADVADIQQFLQHTPAHIPVYPLGLGSNTLVRDGGYRGVIVRMTALNSIAVDGDMITAQAGVSDAKVAKTALQHGLSGLEFMMGIPGAVGGAIAMNAGAYGAEMKHVLVSASALNRRGEQVDLQAADMGMCYRCCAVAEGLIFTRAVLRGVPAHTQDIARHMDTIVTSRAQSQPVKSATGGSTFRNPNGRKAWHLIDSVGLRGYAVGGACISSKHCNFLINTGGATTADLESLLTTAQQKVYDSHHIRLIPEIKIIGDSI